MKNAILLPLFAIACAGPTTPEPTDVFALIGNITVLQFEDPTILGHRLYQLQGASAPEDVTVDSCAELEFALNDEVCAAQDTPCYAETTFFVANETPKCAARVHFFEGSAENQQEDIYAADFIGVANTAPEPLCGNSVIDEGEACDDGNREYDDGCDAHCQFEEFQGCERLIEATFRSAGIATVDADSWRAPRSHLMINTGVATTDLDCADVQQVADNTCTRLMMEMDFVGYCYAQVEQLDDGCAVRLRPHFSSVEPSMGVFTTGLAGLLQFTIR